MLWVLTGNGAQAILQLLVLLVLARLVAPREFGLYSAALVVAGLATIFSELGVGPAIVQRAALEPRHIAAGFTMSMLLGCSAALAAFLGAPFIAALFGMPSLTDIVRFVSVVFVFRGAAVVAEALLQREMDFRSVASVRFGSFALGSGCVSIALALLGLGVWALVWGAVANGFLRMVFALAVKGHAVRFVGDVSAWRELMYFGTGFTLGRLGNYTAFNIDNLVVGRALGAASLGFYGRAFQLMSAPTNLFGEVIDLALFPAMSRLQGERDRLALAVRRGVALAAIVVLPASAALVLLAPEIILVLLGDGWEPVVLPFQILVAATLFRTSYRVSDSLSRATGAVYSRAWRQWVYAGLVAGGAFFGARWGLPGVACGVLVASLAMFLIMAQLSLSKTGLPVREFAAAHVAAAPATLLAAGVTYAAATVLRALGAAPFLVLFATGVLLVACALVALRLQPRWLLGSDGRWMLGLILERFRPAKPRTARESRTTPLGDPE